MVAKVVPILLLAIANVPGGLGNDISKEQPDKDYCNFGVPRKSYDAIDLLRCMNHLASNVGIGESEKSTSEDYFLGRLYSGNEESSRSPWTNLITSFFNGDYNMIYQNLQSSNTPSNQYQSSQYPQTPVGSSSSTGGLDINLFDALYSISRYDDLKCIPRILCEVASGVTPGESIGYGRGSNVFGDFGKNMLLGLLTNFNFVETSPLLSFGKAALLGYTSKGSPRNCYQEYPKCPRNPDQLIYYLNNHNGGFFRFFNKLGLGNRRPPYVFQRNKYFYRDRLPVGKNKPPSLRLRENNSDRTGTSKLGSKFDGVGLNDTWNYERAVFPEERIRYQGPVNRVAFPNDVESAKDFDTSNGLTKTFLSFEGSGPINFFQDSKIFASQKTREEEEEESNRLHTTHQYSESSFRSFVFPGN